MNAGHFSKNLVSTGDLNRGRRTESRVLFGYFLHDAKSDNPFSLQRISRFCKPRISAHKQQLRTIQLNPFSALRRCLCRDGTRSVLFRRPRRLYLCCFRNICRLRRHFPAAKPPLYLSFRKAFSEVFQTADIYEKHIEKANKLCYNIMIRNLPLYGKKPRKGVFEICSNPTFQGISLPLPF